MEVETAPSTQNNNNNNDDQSKQTKEKGKLNSSSGSVPNDAQSESLDVKHPLQHRWTLWFDNPGKKTSQDKWAEHLRQIMTVDTVEDFWRLHNNIVAASGLIPGSNYHFFKENIEPKWEDSANAKGGKWVLTIPSKARKDALDRLWLWTLLACIGEVFEDEDEICGCVVSIRKAQDKIALWTRNAHDEAATVRVGRKLKQALELQDNASLGYQIHIDSIAHNSSFGNTNRYKL